MVKSYGQRNSSPNKIENDFPYKHLENLFSNKKSKQNISDEFRLLQREVLQEYLKNMISIQWFMQ